MLRTLLLVLLVTLFARAAEAQTFYKTPSGKKYHTAACHMVKNVSEQITPQQAQQYGLSPCQICKPPAINSGGTYKAPAGEGSTVQCKGTTKAGTRCRHMTRIANGYCFQHQP